MTQENLKAVEYFSLGISLTDIPDTDPCPWDGGTMQRELLPFEISTDRLIVAADRMPGYGCTECGVKAWHPQVAIQALVKSATIFGRRGNRSEARRLIQEARLLKSLP